MLEHIDLTKVLILDIETVPQTSSYDSLPENWKLLWDKKATALKKEEGQSSSDIYNRAGIYAEFGKIVCISVGYFNRNGNEWSFRLKSFYNDDEKKLLAEFTEMLNKYFNQADHLLCAHNGKEFDFPYISRRCLLNGIDIPKILNLAGKKPWEVQHLDTMEMWKFGDYKSYTSLELLAASFHIPTPKDDIDGSMVWETYWVQQDLERIKTYCQKDVVTVAQLLLRFRNEPLLNDDNIILA